METKVKKYVCVNCGFNFKSKRDFIEHLKDEFDEGTEIADTAVEQLEELGITNYPK